MQVNFTPKSLLARWRDVGLSRHFRIGCVGVLSVFGVMLVPVGAIAEEEPLAPEAVQFFEAKIRPVLVEHCYRCHSLDGQGVRGGLVVDSREGLLGGGESGAAIVPGSLEDSLLWNAINFEDLQMPPRQKLPVNVIKDFETWILMGAPDPRTGDVEVVQTKVTAEAIEAGREHWAFQSPVSSPVPNDSSDTWSVTDIDRFIAAARQEAGLQPVADSDPFTMVRRLHFDLIGLPPSPEDVARFASGWGRNPTSAIRAEVDRLLQSPQFGERWGRHWLDVVRYAESTGKEVDLTFPHAWRYRDYVIDSFNEDKPYDQFIQEQVAGDLLPVKTDEDWAENLIATGFLAMGPKTLVERNPRQFSADIIDEQIDVTTRVVMGLSVACARCHDHKFDPIPQSDYYALAGIFQSTETFFGGGSSQRVRQGSNLIILPVEDANAATQGVSRAEYEAMRKELAEKEQEVQQAQREQRAALLPGGRKLTEQEMQRVRLRAALVEREALQLRERLNQLDENGQPLTLCMGVQDTEQPRNARVLVRGEINQPAQEVERGFVQVVSSGTVDLPQNSSGRLEFAKWMTSRENPLTARVMVNRIWLHLVGKPLVAETDNFGRSGAEPTNAKLLDFLAIRFMDSGWSVKSLIRDIATSRTYRLATSQDEQLLVLDPENKLFARANPKRLEAEAIRDAMLAASGQLEMKRPRGSEISKMGSIVLGPDGVPLGQGFGFRQPPTPLTDIGETYRSVYLPVSRNAIPRSLVVFDFAEPTMVVGMREESNTATQALYLMNNDFVIEQSEQFAKRVVEATDSIPQAIRQAFTIAYGRMPTADEYKAALDFVKDANTESTKIAKSEPAVRPNRFANGDGGPNFAGRNPPFPNNQAGRGQRPGMQAIKDRLRQRMGENGASYQADSLSPMAQFCQALFASAEFRYLD